MKDTDINLTCRQCGRQFVFTTAEQEFYELKGFTAPSRCKECRSTKQTQPQRLVCSQCGIELDKEASIYCSACLASVELEYELKTKKKQEAASAAHTKLLASESEKAELTESLRQKEQLVAELEIKVDNLSQDLDEARQLLVVLEPLQATLNGIQERLEALEHAQNKSNERMLQIVQKMHEMYENIGLFEIIKRSLRHYPKQGIQPT